MSDTARDYQHNDPVSLEGLDNMFEVRELDASLDADCGELHGETVSVEEAAERLNISVRAIQKRLKKGSLAGRKTKTAHGERWLVEVRGLDASRGANRVGLDANNNFFKPGLDELDASWDANQDEQNGAELIDHLAFIRELQNKNEVLVFRTGYLEAELANYKNQVKLLTDSQQHRISWWREFSNWFFKASSQ